MKKLKSNTLIYFACYGNSLCVTHICGFSRNSRTDQVVFGTEVLCQTPLHGHQLRVCCTTPPTDKLTRILQLVVQKFATSQCQSPTSRRVNVGGEFVVQQVVELLWSRLVRWCVVQHVRSRCPCSALWHLLFFALFVTAHKCTVHRCCQSSESC